MKKVFLLCLVFLVTGCVYAAKIDLAVSSSDVTISPAQPQAGDTVSVTVKIHNLGTKNSKASVVKLKITKGTDKIFKQKNSIPAIAVQEDYETTFNVGVLQEGTYNLLVKVDPANAIPETNEGNNKVTLNLNVGGGSAGGPGKVATSIVAFTMNSSSEVFDSIGKVGNGNVKLAEKIFNLIRLAKNPEETINCSKSGTMTITSYLDDLMRPIKMELVYSNCEEWNDQSTNSYERINGQMTLDLTYLSDDIYSPDFHTVSNIVVKTGDGNPSSDTLPDYSIDFFENGTFHDSMTSDYTLTINIFNYDDQGMPTGMAMTLTGTIILTESQNNCTMTFNNLHYDVGISGTQEDMTVSMTIAGTTSFIFESDQSKAVTVTYNNVNYSTHSYGNVIEDSINGLMDVQSPCYNGSISIETIEPIIDEEGADCPVDGVLKVTAGGNTATVTFNSNGTISIDENSDGSVDYSFPCHEAFHYPC